MLNTYVLFFLSYVRLDCLVTLRSARFARIELCFLDMLSLHRALRLTRRR
ncbi:hypothetical protein GUJ93_ZPchr0013g35728 [Zizania palustris]|uniref:Uncharacterized protein n=1 Tax=Zizania palustris TaxID=103762 RepID=A0A8J6BTA7_ZIZPA|nr:hypothetical protein GUJ93_ZPchr0013g35728 [Zizania palustris]